MELVDYIAGLSKIELNDRAKMMCELSEIVNYMDILADIDTDDVEALSHVFPLTNIMRDDTVKESFSRSMILNNAPVENGESFVVPKAVE